MYSALRRTRDLVIHHLPVHPTGHPRTRHGRRGPLRHAAIRQGDLVTVSLTGANRDPAVFPDPDRFDVRRAAHGPHCCLAPRLDPDHPTAPHGLVSRKPPTLHVLWG
jgi:hypothetical protein